MAAQIDPRSVGPLRLLAAGTVALAILGSTPALASAATRYASPSGAAPSGGGPDCTQALPCDLGSAVQGSSVNPGDTVIVEPGIYGSAPLRIPNITNGLDVPLTIRGAGSTPAETKVYIGTLWIRNPATTLSNLSLDVHGIDGLRFSGGLADRLIVSSTGPSLRTCAIFNGELRDSVCTNVGGVAAVFGQSYTDAPQPLSATLRNVTAYATGCDPSNNCYGLDLGSGGGAPASMTVVNSIIHGAGGDVRAYDDSAGGKATVALDHSNYVTALSASPMDTITAPGAGSNQTATPSFVDPAALDLREAPGSPTIDAGTSAGVFSGELDAANSPRVQGSAPDMGAYEAPGTTPPSLQNPIPAFTLAPSSPKVGQSVGFDGRDSSDPNAGGSLVSYKWSFGDGFSATGARPTHAYGAHGFYTVALSVTDNFGLSAQVSHRIAVAPQQPGVRVVSQSRASALSNGVGVRVSGEGQATLRLLLLSSRHNGHQTLLAALTLTLHPGSVTTVPVRLSRKARRLLAAGKHALVQAELTERIGSSTLGPARWVQDLH